MFEELPLLRITVKLLKFMGFILESNWKRYFCLLSCLALNLGQFADMIVTRKGFDSYVIDAYVLAVWSDALMRTTLIIVNRYRYEEFMEELKDVYMDIEANENIEVKRMLEKTSKFARIMGILNLVIGVTVSFGVNIYPLFASSRVLPYSMHIPGVDKYQTPWYEAAYIFQLITTPVGNGMYLPFTNLIMAFIMFGALRCKVLQWRLKNLKNLNGEDVPSEVTWCIRYQMDIMRYVKIINSLTSYIFLVEFVTSGAFLCALMFSLNMGTSKGDSIVIFSHFMMILSQIFSVYWFANELSDESAKVAVAAYDSDWFEFDLKTEKAVMMLITQAQKPCEIMVGNMYPMTLQMFQSLLNASYTYFTLLRELYH